MAVRLRLARFGRKKRPFYRIRAADSRSPRDGKFLETVGYYNPIEDKNGNKQLAVKGDRVKYWLSVGAQPTEAVVRLLARTGNLPEGFQRKPMVKPPTSPKALFSTAARLPTAIGLC